MVSLFVESVPPVYLCCDMLITAEDVASAVRFQNEQRRREHLAWRRVVRRELGQKVSISYNDVGAPQVDIPGRWISVSHGADMVAVALADEPVGVDIESGLRDFERVKSRYMSDHEMTMCSNEAWAAYVWTAKEAMYKLYGCRGVELRNDLMVESFDSSNMIIYGKLVGKRESVVKIAHHDNDTIVAVATFR